MVVIFYKLKFLYVGGIELDYSRRLSEIAARMGYSQSTLRKNIALLRKKKLVQITKHKEMGSH